MFSEVLISCSAAARQAITLAASTACRINLQTFDSGQVLDINRETGREVGDTEIGWIEAHAAT